MVLNFSNSNEEYSIIYDKKTGILRIFNGIVCIGYTKWEHGGSYICLFKNRLTTDRLWFYIWEERGSLSSSLSWNNNINNYAVKVIDMETLVVT